MTHAQTSKESATLLMSVEIRTSFSLFFSFTRPDLCWFLFCHFKRKTSISMQKGNKWHRAHLIILRFSYLRQQPAHHFIK